MLVRESTARSRKSRKRSYYGPNRKHRRSSNCRHRRVTKGAVYLITKKCARDEFLIRPSRLTNQILFYALLDRARKYGIQIISFCFLSNHFHLVLRDVRGLLHPAIAEERDFEARHQRARDRWIGGKRNTVFPHGTFGFHRLYNVRVAGPGKVA